MTAGFPPSVPDAAAVPPASTLGEAVVPLVPAPGATWGEIAHFAYELGQVRGFENQDLRPFAGEFLNRFLQNGEIPLSLGAVERCLYGMQRIHHRLDSPPEADALTFVRVLMEEVRMAHSGPDGEARPTNPRLTALSRLLSSMAAYRHARLTMLTGLGVPRMKASNRDPLSELSEVLSAAFHSGQLAERSTQKGYDVIAASGDRVQVKYLANPTGTWVNGHEIQWLPDVKRYDLVVFEDLTPIAILSFELEKLAAVATKLRKLHGGTDRRLQITQANVSQILQAAATFEALEYGMRVAALPRVTSD